MPKIYNGSLLAAIKGSTVKTYLVATTNQGKLREIQAFFAPSTIRFMGIKDVNFFIEPCVETGSTYEENARIKALHYSRNVHRLTLAEDSGLEIRALDGDPGIRSARFGGDRLSEEDRNALILEKLAGVPPEEMVATYRSIMAVAYLGEVLQVFEGSCEGRIVDTPRGDGGFGYDPIFLSPGIGKTFAQLRAEEKNRVSHRGGALRQFKENLPTLEQEVERLEQSKRRIGVF